MPVKLLNQQVAYEHGGNPFKGLHRWYSRKPLSFSRASVLASLLPEDISLDEFEYLLGLHPELEGLKPDANLRLYKVPPGYFRVGKVHDYCERVWGNRNPTVLDAFAGGGSIPFEAARYGLNVLASDLNPVAVVTMKAAMEYPVKFGPDLQVDIDRWVKWVGDEAEKRLAEFFPSTPKSEEVVQNYLWAHTVVCPSCQSVAPLSPNWWLSKTSNYAGKGQARKVTSDWYAVKPIPNLTEKRVDFELIKGKKGKGTTIKTDEGEYNPDDYTTVSRGVGRCPSCGNIIEDEVIKSQAQSVGLGHQLYAVAYKKGKSSLEFRLPNQFDLDGYQKVLNIFLKNIKNIEIIPIIDIPHGQETERLFSIGIDSWNKLFNPRQLLTLVTYVEIINEAKELIRAEYEPEKVEAICTYLALVLDRCVDMNCRLANWDSSRAGSKRASAQHSLNLMWNYPEINGASELWYWCADAFVSEYRSLCELFGTKAQSLSLPGILETEPKSIKIDAASADSLYHIADKSVDAVITDPPYYATIQYAELSDFFYVWMKRTLGDIFPELFWSEL
ncbi:DNA methylase, partial [Planktothricoides sp. SR001]